MRIAVAGPISTESIAGLLGGRVPDLRGTAGAPLLGTLISALMARGHSVSAFTLDATLNSRRKPVMVSGNGFRIFYIPVRKRAFQYSDGHFGRMSDFFAIERRGLVEMLRSDRADVVHAHWTYEFAMAAIASGLPYVITAHDSPFRVLRYTPTLYRAARVLMAVHVLRRAQQLTAVSGYLCEELKRHAKVAIEVIPNPLPDEIWRMQTGARRPASLDTPQIAMVLNDWTKLKNAGAAIHAFAVLRRKFPNAALHLFGRGYGRGETAEVWARRHGLERGLVFNGTVPYADMLRKLADKDLLLHPALEESFGMSVAEAMALGLPVVAGKSSGAVPWMLEDGRAGVLVDVTRATSIAEALIDLLQNSGRYTQLSEVGIRRAAQLFRADGVAARYEERYRMAIRSVRPLESA